MCVENLHYETLFEHFEKDMEMTAVIDDESFVDTTTARELAVLRDEAQVGDLYERQGSNRNAAGDYEARRQDVATMARALRQDLGFGRDGFATKHPDVPA